MITPLNYIEDLETRNAGFLPTGLPAGDDYVESLVTECFHYLPNEITSLLKSNRLVARSISFDGIMALTKYIEGSEPTYAVVMSNGLRRVLYEVTRIAFGVLYSPSDEQFDSKFESGTNELLALFYHLLDEEIPEMAVGGREEISESIAFESGLVCMFAEKFFLLHEFGHVWLYESNSHQQLDSHEREYYCDTFSAMLLLSNFHQLSDENDNDERFKQWMLRLIYTGIYIALSVYDIAGVFGIKLSDSHPCGFSRQKMLRRNIRQHFGDDFLFSIRKQALVVENFMGEVQERAELKKNDGILEDTVFHADLDRLIAYLKSM